MIAPWILGFIALCASLAGLGVCLAGCSLLIMARRPDPEPIDFDQ